MGRWRKLLLLTVWALLLSLGNVGFLLPENPAEAAGIVYEGCFGDQLSGVSRQIYDAMVSNWCAGSTDSISVAFSEPDIYQVPKEVWEEEKQNSKEYKEIHEMIINDMQSAYDAFIYDHPEVYWLSDMESSITTTNGRITNVFLKPYECYPGAKTEVTSFTQAVKLKKEEIRSSVSSGRRADIVREIHDTLCEETSYGKGSSAAGDVAHTAAGIFLKDRVVLCEGYAKAFKILCDQFQIPCILVIGNAQGTHMWNYVKMDDGKWYLVDVTWDDQESGIQNTYFLAGSSTVGYSGAMIGKEHTAYTDFSGSGVRQFVLPELSVQAYTGEKHIWTEVSEKKGTCQTYGKAVYRCSLCGLEKTELLEKTGHSWGEYHSNKDATCLKDGTKTAECIYGCGKSRTAQDTGSKLKPTIKLNAVKVVLQTGQSTNQLKIEKLGKGDSVVSWKSNKTSVVTVKKNGKLGASLKAGNVGSATVTVTLKSKLKKRIQVVVQRKKVQTKKITGVPDNLKIKKGSTVRLSPVRVPFTSLEKITYSSSDQKVAAVSSKGIVTGKKKGIAVITVSSGKIRKKCKITVT